MINVILRTYPNLFLPELHQPLQNILEPQKHEFPLRTFHQEDQLQQTRGYAHANGGHSQFQDLRFCIHPS